MGKKIIICVTLLGFLFLLNSSVFSSQPEEILSEDLWLRGEAFAGGSGEGVVVTEAGLQLAPGAPAGHYLSPPLSAPIPFNAVFPQWRADLPPAADLSIMMRTGLNNGVWSDWVELHGHADWSLPDDPDIVGNMLTAPADDGTHRLAQFSVALQRLDAGVSPVLEELRLTFIDSTAGPTAEELVARQQALDAERRTGFTPDSAAGYPKPPVVSREVWCTHEACNYSEGLVYQPVTHLVVHHTASSNDHSDWAAVVRAIWHFHTFTRGWGDIGYNYLVDMNGVLYEGHLGGDDVVGTHAAYANHGTMGLSLIGNFVSYDPPAAMLNSAAAILAWKADQKQIDVFNASRLAPVGNNASHGLPHLMGHRDVLGNTQCPGDKSHILLPWLRQEVANRIGFVSPYMYVDELSGAFTKSDANWYSTSSGCGFNGHAYYTWSTTNPDHSTNWGEWRPQLEYTGRYEVWAYAPYCITGRRETDGATYTITHANGSSEVVVSHETNVGLWFLLGEYDFAAGASGKIRLTDLTTTDNDWGVWFDAIRLRYLGPLVVNQQPAHNSWLNNRQVQFNWQVTNGASVANTRLEVATDPAFTNKIHTFETEGLVTSHTHTFSQDANHLHWRVILTTTQGHPLTSSATRFSIDTTPPIASMQGIYRRTNGQLIIAWQGQDDGIGVASYDVQFRVKGMTAWSSWLQGFSGTASQFTPPEGDGNNPPYEFRVRARDHLDNLGEWSDAGGFDTEQAIYLAHDIMLPLLNR